MSEILRRLQNQLKKVKEKEDEKKPRVKRIKKEPTATMPPQRKRRGRRPLLEGPIYQKKNAQHNKSLLLQLLKTVNVTNLTKKQKRALNSLGTFEPVDKSDRKLVTLWDQKKTTIASLELILSILMQQPIEIQFKK
ncbi:MAG: hypothetical protein ACTSRS_17985 [Candidatus Helarchaeota archaeon]